MATSYSNTGGTGDRRGFITATTSGNLGTGSTTPSNLVDGTLSNNFFWGSALDSSRWLKFDFGLDEYIVDELKLYQSATTTHGVWQFEGSHDDSAWTSIGPTFTLGSGGSAGISTHSFTNSTRYRYYRLLGVSGSSNSGPYVREFEFKISVESFANEDCSYSNTGGTGNRSGSITVSTSCAFGVSSGSVAIGRLVDGVSANDIWIKELAAIAGKYIRFDFGSGQSIDQVRIKGSLDAAIGTWKWQGSNDASAWTDLGSAETKGNTGLYHYFRSLGPGSSSGYRYFQMVGVSGGCNARWFDEFDFRIAAMAAPSGPSIGWLQGNRIIDMYRKNTAGQNLAFVLIDAATGAGLAGATVTGYRSIDGGAQAAVTGTISEKANGQYNLALSAADCNGNHVGFLFTATGAVPASLAIVTTVDDPTTGTAAGTAAAVWATAIETGWSALETTRIMLSALAGKVSGANTTSIAFRDVGDTKARISATVDQYGNRTVVSHDKT